MKRKEPLETEKAGRDAGAKNKIPSQNPWVRETCLLCI